MVWMRMIPRQHGKESGRMAFDLKISTACCLFLFVFFIFVFVFSVLQDRVSL